MDLLSKTSYMLALLCLGSLSGAYSIMLNLGYLICANIKERHGYRWPVLYALFELALIGIMLGNFEGISSVLIFCSTSISLFSIWWMPPQKMRLLGLGANFITLSYHISLRNWAGVFEFAVIASNVSSYLKYRRSGNNSGKVCEEGTSAEELCPGE